VEAFGGNEEERCAVMNLTHGVSHGTPTSWSTLITLPRVNGVNLLANADRVNGVTKEEKGD